MAAGPRWLLVASLAEKTPYAVTGGGITLASNAVPGWNEIDAVQLLGD